MKNITKERYNEVIEYFGGKKIPQMDTEKNELKAVGNPVLLGDVLEKISKKREYYWETTGRWIDLLKLWHTCGFSLSLQEIAEGGWEEKFIPVKRGEETDDIINVLKQPQSDLISFLHNLIQ